MSEPALLELDDIVERLGKHYTPVEIQTWLNAPHPQLAGAQAIDLIRQGRALEVLAVIDRLDTEVHL